MNGMKEQVNKTFDFISALVFLNKRDMAKERKTISKWKFPWLFNWMATFT